MNQAQLKNSNAEKSVSGRLGTLSTRLAASANEIRAAQRVRYEVFRGDFEANISTTEGPDQEGNIDADRYDQVFDHLLVIDHQKTDQQTIVGTQRFAVRDASAGADDFYSSLEFDLSTLLKNNLGKRFMELGRSCILEQYRNKRTMELLWHGTWDYALKNEADVMLGCASFAADDPQEIAEELGFLSGLRAVENWFVSSQRPDAIDIGQFAKHVQNPKHALRKLPPLIKGYLRLGAKFSDCAVPDPEFGTIDVLVVLPVADINPKYVAHYGENAERHRA